MSLKRDKNRSNSRRRSRNQHISENQNVENNNDQMDLAENDNMNVASNNEESKNEIEDESFDLIRFKDLLQIVRELPKWGKDSVCYEFLRNLKMKLLNSGLPEYEWVRLLPHLFPGDLDKAEWINENIDYKMHSWDHACKTFENHFQEMDYHEQIQTAFDKCHQAKDSLVQTYADEFELLCHKLDIQDNNSMAVTKFIIGLNPAVVRSFYDHVTKVPTAVTKVNGSFSSLRQVMAVCMALDVAYRTSQHAIGEMFGKKSGFTEESTIKDNSNNENIDKPYCRYHPNLHNHTTAECRSLKKRGPSSSFTNSTRSNGFDGVNKHQRTQWPERQNENIICYKCNEPGHIATNCPEKTVAGSVKSFTNNSIVPPSYNSVSNNIDTKGSIPFNGNINQNINNSINRSANPSFQVQRQIRMLRKELKKQKKRNFKQWGKKSAENLNGNNNTSNDNHSE